MFENRNYLVFNMSEVDNIDFRGVLETSPDTLRLSVDEEKSFIKWEGETPSFITDLTNTEGPYSHTEILEVLSDEAWTSTDEITGEINEVPNDEVAVVADEATITTDEITEEMLEILNAEAAALADETTE